MIAIYKGRLGGQITVYAALALGISLTFVLTCINSAKMMIADTEINMATRLSAESVFAGYNEELLEEFDIFAASGKQCNDNKLAHYARGNIDNMALANFMEYSSSRVVNPIYMTDRGAEGVKLQIQEYMKSGGYAQLILDYLEVEKQMKKAQVIEEVTNQIDDIDTKMAVLNECDLRLVQLIDGIRTTDSRFEASRGKPMASGDDYCKMLVDRSVSMSKVGVSYSDVYESVRGSGRGYEEMTDIVSGILDTVSAYYECLDEEDYEGAMSCAADYSSSRDDLIGLVQDMENSTTQAIGVIARYHSAELEVDAAIARCRGYVLDNEDKLDEVTSVLRNDVDDIKVQKDTFKNRFCNKNLFLPILEGNRTVLGSVVSILNSTPSSVDGGSMSGFYEAIDVMGGVELSLLEFRYSQADFNNKGDGTKSVKKILKKMRSGVAGIVLEGFDVKSGGIRHDRRAIDYCSADDAVAAGDTLLNIDGADKVSRNPLKITIDKAVLNGYIFQKLPSYTDVHNSDESKRVEDWSSVNYAVEYLIAGHENDKDNLEQVVTLLTLLREGPNFTHLVCDSAKRNQALTMAVTLVGATGNMGVIKAAQYMIMGAWAYGESIVDVRRLLDEENVALVKTSADWRLTLEKLLLMKLNHRADEKTKNNNASLTDGFNYEDYLGTLLLLVNQRTLIYRCMTDMEARVIALGDKDFRMCSYIYEAIIEVVARIRGGEESVTRSQLYSYSK